MRKLSDLLLGKNMMVDVAEMYSFLYTILVVSKE